MNTVMPQSVLFVCNMNSIRSPMAEVIARDFLGGGVLIQSAGVYDGEIDFFIDETLGEIGLKLGEHHPKMLSSLDIEIFDVIIALTPEATQAAADLGAFGHVEYWQISNPTDIRGGREQIMMAYRTTRDEIYARIQMRFCQK